LAKVQANREALIDFEGSGALEIANSKMGRAMMGVAMRHVGPDYLLLSIYGPMGIQLGSMLLAGERFQLSYGLPPVRAEGNIEDFQFPEDFAIPLSGRDMLRLLLPLELISASLDSVALEKDLERRAYRLEGITGGLRHTLWLDPYRPVCTGELMLSSSGDTLIFKEIADISRRNGVHFPLAWNLQMGQGAEENFMCFKFRRLAVNSGLEPKDLPLQLPVQADTIGVNHGR
jgi:hypothetical protein